MEFRDQLDNDQDYALLGLPAESDWILYAPNNFEPVLIHNPLEYELSNELGTIRAAHAICGGVPEHQRRADHCGQL